MIVGYGKRGALVCRVSCGENGSAESREEVVKAQSRRFRVSPSRRFMV